MHTGTRSAHMHMHFCHTNTVLWCCFVHVRGPGSWMVQLTALTNYKLARCT